MNCKGFLTKLYHEPKDGGERHEGCDRENQPLHGFEPWPFNEFTWTFWYCLGLVLGFLSFTAIPGPLIFSLKFKDFKKTLNLRLLPGSGWLKLSVYHFKARHSWGSMESWVENFSLHWRLVTVLSQFSNKNALNWCQNSRHFRSKWSDFDRFYGWIEFEIGFRRRKWKLDLSLGFSVLCALSRICQLWQFFVDVFIAKLWVWRSPTHAI